MAPREREMMTELYPPVRRPTADQWIDVKAYGVVHLACRYHPQTDTVTIRGPWTGQMIELAFTELSLWRPRESQHKMGTAYWQAVME